MHSTAQERPLTAYDSWTPSRAGPAEAGGAASIWPILLPLLIALALASVLADAGAAGACTGTGLTQGDLPELSAALHRMAG